MVAYSLSLGDVALSFLESLDEKSKRICKAHLKKLQDHPYPGRGIGDKERLSVKGIETYRMHVGRTFTIFYDVIEAKKEVQVLEITTIDAAHKAYGP